MPRKEPPGSDERIGPLRIPVNPTPGMDVPWKIIKESERRRKGGYDIPQLPADQPEIDISRLPPERRPGKDRPSNTWEMRAASKRKPEKGNVPDRS
jgi:hypothetical protein